MYNSQKAQLHTSKCVFIGYGSEHKWYKCLSYIGTFILQKVLTLMKNNFLLPLVFLLSENLRIQNKVQHGQQQHHYMLCIINQSQLTQLKNMVVMLESI